MSCLSFDYCLCFPRTTYVGYLSLFLPPFRRLSVCVSPRHPPWYFPSDLILCMWELASDTKFCWFVYALCCVLFRRRNSPLAVARHARASPASSVGIWTRRSSTPPVTVQSTSRRRRHPGASPLSPRPLPKSLRRTFGCVRLSFFCLTSWYRRYITFLCVFRITRGRKPQLQLLSLAFLFCRLRVFCRGSVCGQITIVWMKGQEQTDLF